MFFAAVIEIDRDPIKAIRGLRSLRGGTVLRYASLPEELCEKLPKGIFAHQHTTTMLHMVYRIITFLLVAATLVGCASLNESDINRFIKGMSPDQVRSIATRKPYDTRTFTLPSMPGDRFTVMFFTFEPIEDDGYLDYHVAFRNDKLFYWGYPYEFNRSPDTLLNAIGAAVVEQP